MLTVRKISSKDVPLIAGYWSSASRDDLLKMGALKEMIPSKEELVAHISKQVEAPLHKQQMFILIWEMSGHAIGHCFVNKIEIGHQAHMHLHLWKINTRKKGIGVPLLKQSIPVFFKELKLQTLWCEPYAKNPAPNKALVKVGFKLVKSYWGIPGTWCFEQEINQYKITRSELVSES